MYVTFDYELTGNIVPLEPRSEFVWRMSYEALEDESSYRNITTLTIHYNSQLVWNLQDEIQRTVDTGKFETRLTCHQGEKYEFRKVESRKFRLDLPGNEQLLVETSKVTNRMTVMVKFDPKLLDVYFVHKTIDYFEDLETSPGRIYKSHPGVLLPSHGFYLIFGCRKN